MFYASSSLVCTPNALEQEGQRASRARSRARRGCAGSRRRPASGTSGSCPSRPRSTCCSSAARRAAIGAILKTVVDPDPLVGREPALAVLARARAVAADRWSRVVLVRGEAGIGKTALLTEAGRRVADGACVLWGQCWDGDGAPAYWPWVQVARAAAVSDIPWPAERAEDATARFDLSTACCGCSPGWPSARPSSSCSTTCSGLTTTPLHSSASSPGTCTARRCSSSRRIATWRRHRRWRTSPPRRCRWAASTGPASRR